ncbi:MAG: hypothetical protein P4L45_15875, partial [Ignavibacteriaceae bacterium]|nr:hypothetical protein [Ignavibacteriaceae bacterium]
MQESVIEKQKNNPNDTIDKIVSLAKRKGFVFQSSEIYGGLNGCWDYGPLGVELLKNIKEEWWKFMTYRENIEGIDASILMHPKVWEASGHVENFTDPMVDCKQCKTRYRLDFVPIKFRCTNCHRTINLDLNPDIIENLLTTQISGEQAVKDLISEYA